MVKIKELLIKNAFPVKFKENEMNKLEKSKLNLEEINISTQEIEYIAIPYIKKISEKFCKNLTKTLGQIGTKTRVSFSIVKVESWFSLKEL